MPLSKGIEESTISLMSEPSSSGEPALSAIRGKLASASVYPEFFPINPTQKVLNVGCGLCAQVVAYGPSFSWMVGLDVQHSRLVKAKKITSHHRLPVDFCQAAAEFLPFQGESFDTLLAIDLIEHVKDPEKVISELHRVCKQKGQLLITFPAMHDRIVHFASFLRKIFLPFYKSRHKVKEGWDPDQHNQEFSLKKWKMMMQRRGFRLIRSCASTLFPPLHLYGISRFWFTWKWLHSIDSFFSSLPLLKNWGQTLVCIYEKES